MVGLLHALLKPKQEDDTHLFPTVEWVGEAIREKIRLEKALGRVNDALDQVQIEHRGMNAGGSRMYSARTEDDVTECLTTLKQRYREKTQLAERFAKVGGVDAAIKYVEKIKMTRKLRY